VLIAEEDARMGFPEILFNLFPGMGAYSFLSRKVGRRVTEELITSGTIYTARQLYDLGVVDVITPTGTGEAAVESYVRKHARSGNGRRGIEAVAREMNPLDPAVITVGSIHGGTKYNIIPDEVKLQLTVRSFTEPVRMKLLAAIARIAKAEAEAAGAEKLPTIRRTIVAEALSNDPALDWFGEPELSQPLSQSP
jgi:enoyl-CoA hydratase/carnithine racemase